MRSVLGTVNALAAAVKLPGALDFETDFAPGRAYVRRVPGHNLWVLYRFGATHLDALTVRDEPPVPIDPAS